MLNKCIIFLRQGGQNIVEFKRNAFYSLFIKCASITINLLFISFLDTSIIRETINIPLRILEKWNNLSSIVINNLHLYSAQCFSQFKEISILMNNNTKGIWNA